MELRIKDQKGFTLIELVVVMVILALLAAVAVPKFLDLQKQAEVSSVRKVVGNIRSALSIRTAQALVNGEVLADLAGTLYPMELLSTVPEPYEGKQGAPLSLTDYKGVWWQGNGSHDLYYNPRSVDLADDLIAGRMRYEIEVVQETVGTVTSDVGLVLERYDDDITVDASDTDDTGYNWLY